MSRQRILFAPDSFKGTLSSVEVAQALAEGWARRRPDDELLLAPLADGGDGTIAAVAAAQPDGLARHTARVADPLGRTIDATYLTIGDGSTAIVELATASGLTRLSAGERDPLRASTDGTGTLLREALLGGARRVLLGLGGSATTDGGSGLLRGLGARILDASGRDLAPGGAALKHAAAVDLAALVGGLDAVEVVAATDVRNPLLGPDGAAAVYGPQKGASPADVALLDAALERWVGILEAMSGRRLRDVPGTGAAGGAPVALLAIADRLGGVTMRPGIDVVMELTGFDERLAASDLVVTGEGRLDAQTASGKTVLGVARRARAAHVRCAAVVGSIAAGGREAIAGMVAPIIATSDGGRAVEELIALGAGPVRDAGARLADLVFPA